MKTKYLISFLTVLILSCGIISQRPPAQEATSAPPVQQPTQAPVQIPPTESHVDPNYFRDDFNIKLESGWEWLREDPNHWSLTVVPGSLQIDTNGGKVKDESVSNLLLRPAPAGDFQIETKVNFHPTANFQFAGLIIYESAPNFIQAGRAFCDNPSTCAGNGLYIDYYQNGEFIMPNFAVPYTESDEIYLRLVHQGNTYTLQTSSNGSEWILRGGQESNMKSLQIGLVTGQNSSSVIPALFDYFEVRSIP